MKSKKPYMLLLAIAAVAASGGFYTFQNAQADSATGGPTEWSGSLVTGQVSIETYTVPAGAAAFNASLQIDTLTEKPNVVLTVTDPFGAVIVCPVIPATALTVAECAIGAPLPGVWMVTVAGPTIVAPSIGYTVSADTV